jgi:hypothetical protein
MATSCNIGGYSAGAGPVIFSWYCVPSALCSLCNFLARDAQKMSNDGTIFVKLCRTLYSKHEFQFGVFGLSEMQLMMRVNCRLMCYETIDMYILKLNFKKCVKKNIKQLKILLFLLFLLTYLRPVSAADTKGP